MYYVVDEKGNKIEGYDKQGFLAVLQQAIDDGDLDSIDADSAFVSKLKCCVGGGTFKVAFVTQAQYNSLRDAGQLIANALYFITDDNTEVNLENLVAEVQSEIDGLVGDGGTIASIVDGSTKISIKDENNTSQQLNMSTGVLKVGSEIIEKKKLLYSYVEGETLINTFDVSELNLSPENCHFEVVYGSRRSEPAGWLRTYRRFTTSSVNNNSDTDCPAHISWSSVGGNNITLLTYNEQVGTHITNNLFVDVFANSTAVNSTVISSGSVASTSTTYNLYIKEIWAIKRMA